MRKKATLAELIAKARAKANFGETFAIANFVGEMNRLLSEQDVSKSELARRIGTSPAFVSKLMSLEGNVTLKTISKVFFALGARPRIVAIPITQIAVHDPKVCDHDHVWSPGGKIVPFPITKSSILSELGAGLSPAQSTQPPLAHFSFTTIDEHELRAA